MALWARTQQLPPETLNQIKSLYRGDYPMEIRHYLAEWIESRCWDELRPNNLEHELLATKTVTHVCNELEALVAKLGSPDNFLVRMKLQDVLDNFKRAFSSDPVSFVNLVRANLATEYRLVKESEMVVKPSLILDEELMITNAGILRELDQVRLRTQSESEAIATLSHSQESVAIMLHQYNQIVSGLENLMASQPHMFAENASSVNREIVRNLEEQKASVYSGLSKKVSEVIAMRRKSAENLSHTVSLISCVQSKVLGDELSKWKRAHQLAQNGGPAPCHLDQIQVWCEGLAEVVWINRNQVGELTHLKTMLNVQEGNGGLGNGVSLAPEIDLNSLMMKINELLSQLVSSAFIVETQPPQVMKTNTRFTASVRFLVGGKLNIHMSAPKVRVSIVNEQEAAALKNRRLGPWLESSGEILNNTGTLEYHQASRHLSVSFRNLQLKKIKRSDKKVNEINVTEEKYAILFQTEFMLGNEKLYFPIFCLSLPVVVIVHGTQEAMAWASICWDNAFCPADASSVNSEHCPSSPSSPAPSSGPKSLTPSLPPFGVSWFQIRELLAMKFLQAMTSPTSGAIGVQQGDVKPPSFALSSCSMEGSLSLPPLGLNEDHLSFLASKLWREPVPPEDCDFDVTWSSFCKDPLPGRNFSFWDWFFAAMRVIRDHLKDLWNSGCILGFISRGTAEDMLLNTKHGTFLLRFSDSELGGLTVAWIAEDPSTGKKEVFMLQPFNAKDFAIRSLADRISDLKYLVKLYPDVSKDEAFGKFYSPPGRERTKDCNGYVKPNLVTQVPGWTELSMSSSSSEATIPATPHSMPELGEKKFLPGESRMDFGAKSGAQFDTLHAVMSYGLDTSAALPAEFNPRDGFHYLTSLAAPNAGRHDQLSSPNLVNNFVAGLDCEMAIPVALNEAGITFEELNFISEYA